MTRLGPGSEPRGVYDASIIANRRHLGLFMWRAACVCITAWVCAEPRQHTMTPPDSIPADGARDVTDALNAFFKSVPSNTRITFPADAKYRIDGQGALLRAVDPGEDAVKSENYAPGGRCGRTPICVFAAGVTSSFATSKSTALTPMRDAAEPTTPTAKPSTASTSAASKTAASKT